MESVHPSNLCLAALIFFYGLNFGPMVFESFTSDRIWASNPPASFSMFLGQYGQKTAPYWRIVSPCAVAAFVLSFVFNWPASGRASLMAVAFVLCLAVQLSTMAHFVREQEQLISSADSLSRDILRFRAHRWMFLNRFRIVAGLSAYFFLLFAAFVPRVP